MAPSSRVSALPRRSGAPSVLQVEDPDVHVSRCSFCGKDCDAHACVPRGCLYGSGCTVTADVMCACSVPAAAHAGVLRYSRLDRKCSVWSDEG